MKEYQTFLSFWNQAKNIIVLFPEDVSYIEELTKYNGSNIYGFEKPDFYFEFEDKVILMEHFSFDSSKRIRKGGSLQKIEEHNMDKKFQNYVNYQHSKGNKEVQFRSSYNTKTSFDDYEKNLIDSFCNHLKFDDYEKNFRQLVKSKKPCEYGVCIENTSLLPDIVYNQKGSLIVLPINSFKFLDKLKANQDIKHIFILQRGNMSEKCVYYFENNSKNLDRLFNGVIVDETYKFANMKPHTLGFSYIIPKE